MPKRRRRSQERRRPKRRSQERRRPLNRIGEVLPGVTIDAGGRPRVRGRPISFAEFDKRSRKFHRQQRVPFEKLRFPQLKRYEIRSDGLIFDSKRTRFISGGEFSRRLRISLSKKPRIFVSTSSFFGLQDMERFKRQIKRDPKGKVEYELFVSGFQSGKAFRFSIGKQGFAPRTKTDKVVGDLLGMTRQKLFEEGKLVNTERFPQHKPGNPNWTVFTTWELKVTPRVGKFPRRLREIRAAAAARRRRK